MQNSLVIYQAANILIIVLYTFAVQMFFVTSAVLSAVRGSALVEALRYKPEGRGFDSRWCHWNSSLT